MAKIPQSTASRAVNSLGQAITAFPDNAIIVTPSDDDHYDTPINVQALEAGDIAVVPAGSGENGTPITLTLAAGAWVPFRVVKVMATNTDITAGGILGVY